MRPRSDRFGDRGVEGVAPIFQGDKEETVTCSLSSYGIRTP
ncbi:hypothetical protein CKA32_003501 [Geitlerinema sp. FC II]|nr:hypothetical protein CKA32_003501 [Geitlerinema sp. FC II]